MVSPKQQLITTIGRISGKVSNKRHVPQENCRESQAIANQCG
jgi:hypothetical protein